MDDQNIAVLVLISIALVPIGLAVLFAGMRDGKKAFKRRQHRQTAVHPSNPQKKAN